MCWTRGEQACLVQTVGRKKRGTGGEGVGREKEGDRRQRILIYFLFWIYGTDAKTVLGVPSHRPLAQLPPLTSYIARRVCHAEKRTLVPSVNQTPAVRISPLFPLMSSACPRSHGAPHSRWGCELSVTLKTSHPGDPTALQHPTRRPHVCSSV